MSRVAMLASKEGTGAKLKIALLVTLLGVSSVLLAADTDLPDMDLLEYLGLWEESDEEWVLLSEDTGTQVAAEDTLTDSTSADDEAAEKNDES